ncbi:hypothetical protein D3C78_1458640 [compost metagenome]
MKLDDRDVTGVLVTAGAACEVATRMVCGSALRLDSYSALVCDGISSALQGQLLKLSSDPATILPLLLMYETPPQITYVSLSFPQETRSPSRACAKPNIMT